MGRKQALDATIDGRQARLARMEEATAWSQQEIVNMQNRANQRTARLVDLGSMDRRNTELAVAAMLDGLGLRATAIDVQDGPSRAATVEFASSAEKEALADAIRRGRARVTGPPPYRLAADGALKAAARAMMAQPGTIQILWPQKGSYWTWRAARRWSGSSGSTTRSARRSSTSARILRWLRR